MESVQGIISLLTRVGLSEYVSTFIREEVDNLELLSSLREEDLVGLIPNPDHHKALLQYLETDVILRILSRLGRLNMYGPKFLDGEVSDITTFQLLTPSDLEALIPDSNHRNEVVKAVQDYAALTASGTSLVSSTSQALVSDVLTPARPPTPTETAAVPENMKTPIAVTSPMGINSDIIKAFVREYPDNASAFISTVCYSDPAMREILFHMLHVVGMSQ